MTWFVESVPCDVDALALFAVSRAPDRFFWSQGQHAIAASGALHVLASRGATRFEAAVSALAQLLPSIEARGVAAADSSLPILVGGFAFAGDSGSDPVWSGFDALRFVLPALTLVQRDGANLLVGVEPAAPHASETAARAALRQRLLRERERLARLGGVAHTGSVARAYRVEADRSHAQYRSLVVRARDAVRAGTFSKLVVARSVRLASREPIDVVALLGALRRSHPSCTTFAVTRGDRTFLGASPENLVRVRGRRVSAAALAGTAARGRSPEEDECLGRALRESKKEQEEHTTVVHALRVGLAPLCSMLDVPESPRLLRVEGIQHLETAIEGTLREDTPLLDLAGRLHPTPAVAGVPREAAITWLAEHEALARGWYAGGVGWIDARGGGELCAALRSGLVCGTDAHLYAGAGIVAASDPEAELVETRLKLRALLVPLLEL
jgi:salicylate biosynthesis isochorismate synthase/menaquinone-specific isochorismate synthase